MKDNIKTFISKSLTAFLFILLSASFFCAANDWVPDSLGDGYYMKYIPLSSNKKGDSARCTVIRKMSSCHTHRAVLYIHGYNDYFFQKEEGNRWTDSCFNFYAVDLQGYGRSILPGERKFMCTSVKNYFQDIDSALNIIRSQGNNEIVMMGHSTGGLVAADYLSLNHPEDVRALILNSPFLDWNFSGFVRRIGIPVVSFIGGIFPRINISQGKKSIYSESLREDMHGRWKFNHAWKVSVPEKVTTGWIRAICKAQKEVRKGKIDIPVLLMYSAKSVYGKTWTPEFQEGDAVLNVKLIAEQGRKLGPYVTELKIDGALHDIFLSSPEVVDRAYEDMFAWLKKTL